MTEGLDRSRGAQGRRGSLAPAAAWVRAVAAVALMYVGGAALSLALALDNFDRGVKASDEVVYALLGILGLGLIAAPFVLRFGRRVPRRGGLVALVIAPSAAVATYLLLSAYQRGVTPGEAVPASAQVYRRLALAVVAIAPLVAGALAGREHRRELFVGATALIGAGWFIALAAVMIQYR